MARTIENSFFYQYCLERFARFIKWHTDPETMNGTLFGEDIEDLETVIYRHTVVRPNLEIMMVISKVNRGMTAFAYNPQNLTEKGLIVTTYKTPIGASYSRQERGMPVLWPTRRGHFEDLTSLYTDVVHQRNNGWRRMLTVMGFKEAFRECEEEFYSEIGKTYVKLMTPDDPCVMEALNFVLPKSRKNHIGIPAPRDSNFELLKPEEFRFKVDILIQDDNTEFDAEGNIIKGPGMQRMYKAFRFDCLDDWYKEDIDVGPNELLTGEENLENDELMIDPAGYFDRSLGRM